MTNRKPLYNPPPEGKARVQGATWIVVANVERELMPHETTETERETLAELQEMNPDIGLTLRTGIFVHYGPFDTEADAVAYAELVDGAAHSLVAPIAREIA